MKTNKQIGCRQTVSPKPRSREPSLWVAQTVSDTLKGPNADSRSPNAIRADCLANRRVLFGIADIESHDPAGNAVTFTNAGTISTIFTNDPSAEGLLFRLATF